MDGFEAEDKLEAFDPQTGELLVVIETPQKSRNKYKLDLEVGQFRLDKILPAGMAFPYDFGFIPSTRGADGDPLDVLLFTDTPSFTGCLVLGRLIGVIEAEQTEEGKRERNDRLLVVASESHDHRDIKDIAQLNPSLLKEIEDFFTSYNAVRGKQFKALGRKGPAQAHKLVEDGMRLYEKQAAKGKKKNGKKNAKRK